MSRIIRPRVEPGEVTDATTLNNTYDDYSQSGALNSSNTREAAFDLPHMNNDVQMLMRSAGPALLGTGAKAHPAVNYVTVPALTSGTTEHIVEDGAGNPTFLDLSSNPFVMTAGTCLRVWWNLSMYTNRSGTPYLNASTFGRYNVSNKAGTGLVQLSDGFHSWLAWLQWDITSAALTNWQPVSTQTNIVTNVQSTDNGILLSNTGASTCISPWVLTSEGFGDGGRMPAGNQGDVRDHEWFAPYGMYVREAGSTFSIYGIRLVVAGLFHPKHNGDINYHALDYTVGVDQELLYTSGRIQAVQMRMG